MTAGLLALGLGAIALGYELRRQEVGFTWIPVTTCGVATLAVAAIPLGGGADWAHGVAAAAAYAALAGSPLVASRSLPIYAVERRLSAAKVLLKRSGRSQRFTARRVPQTASGASWAWSWASLVAGSTSVVALIASTAVSGKSGLFQRVGLSAGDIWLVAAAIGQWRQASRSHTGH